MALEPIKLTQDTFRTSLTQHLQYFEDQSNQLTFDQALKKLQTGEFKVAESSSLQFGYQKSAFWVAFAIHNGLPGTRTHFLEIRYPPLDFIDVYMLKDRQLIEHLKGGDRLNYNERPYQARFHLFPLRFTEQTTYTILVKVKTESSYSLPIAFSTDVAFVQTDHYEQVALGIYYGICIGLFAYNLFLFFTIKETIYLKYIAYVLCHTSFTASLDGLLYQFWPESIDWENRSIYMAAWLTGVFLFWFCSDFLQLKQAMPIAYKVTLAAQVIFLLGVIGISFLPIAFATRINAPMILVGVILMFTFTIKRYLQGYKPAGYFLVGMGSFLIGAALVATGSLNIFSQYDLSPILLKIGAATEIFCFSIGLGNRINTLKAEQASAKHEAELAKTEAQARKRYAQEMENINKQLEIAMQARSDFLANMSHEIRTPMNGVLGMLELVHDTHLTKEQENYINVASRSGTTLLALINDILDLSKIEAGKLELESISFNLKQVIEDLKSLFNVQLHDKALYFDSEFEAGLPIWVKGDRTRVWQILTNLIGNAIKFTNKGGIKVSVFSHNNQYCISVQDSGIGIAEEALPKIFDSFTQADSSTTRKFGGTGLGLTISKRLATLMGGDITVQSKPNEGTTFTVYLDLQPTAAPAEQQTVNDDGVISDSCYGLNVLLAEDNIVNQQVANGIFKKLGVNVEIVSDGIEAVSKCHTNQYDLIFMDIQMPNLDGYGATKTIKSTPNPNQHTPIIAMTANAMQGDKEKCLAVGMNDYLTKPIQKERLREMILRWKKLKASA